MTDAPKLSGKPDLDMLERELRRLHEMQQKARPSNDRLAELARIVGSDDPFAVAKPRTEPTFDPPAYATPSVDPPAAPASPAAQRPARGPADPPRLSDFLARQGRAAPASAPPQPSPRLPEDDGYSPDRSYAGQGASGLSREDLGYPIDLDAEQPRDIRLPPAAAAPESEPRRAPFMVRLAAPLLLLGVMVGGGLYAFGYIGAQDGAEPETLAEAPVIRAPQTPMRVEPTGQQPIEPLGQGTRLLERQTEDPQAPETLVNRSEQPVELGAGLPQPSAPRLIPLEGDRDQQVVILPPAPAAPDSAPEAAPAPSPEAPPADAVPGANAAAEAQPLPPPLAEAPPPASAAPVGEAPAAEAPADEAPADESPAGPGPTDLAALLPPEGAPDPAPTPDPPEPEPAPEAATPAAAAPPADTVPASRVNRIRPVEVPTRLASLLVEEPPGPGIADQPRRVRSVRFTPEGQTAPPEPAAEAASAPPAAPEPTPVAPPPEPAPAEPAAAPPAAEPETVELGPAEAVPAAPPTAEAPPLAAPAPDDAEARAAARREAQARQREERRRIAQQRAAEAVAAERRRAAATQAEGPISLDPGAAPRPVTQNAGGAGGAFAVQFAGADSEASAQAEARRVASRYGVTPRVVRASVNGRTVYRVRSGGLSRARANELCASVRAAGGSCFVSGGG
jgi:hypothetical protein